MGRTALDVATKYGKLNEPVMDLLVRSSGQAKKLDVSKLMDHCQDRDVAYVKDAVADFGAQGKIQSRMQGHELQIIVPRSHF